MTTAQEENLINLLDGYVEKGGHHLNVNVVIRKDFIHLQQDIIHSVVILVLQMMKM